jgi:hypothetical protein
MTVATTGETDDDAEERSVCLTARLCWGHRGGAELGRSPSGSCFNDDDTIDHRRDDESHDHLDR